MNKWVKKWKVPGSNSNIWTVAQDKDGNYGCSCPLWKFKRQECHHILQIKETGGEEIMPLTAEEQANLKLRTYAKRGYRYHIWYNDPPYPWEKRDIEALKRNPDIEAVRTFAANNHRIVLIKERESAYEKRVDDFVALLKRCNLSRKFVKNPLHTGNWWEHDYWITQDELRDRLRKRWFDIVQHILYNSTGIINPNLPEGSVYTTGYWGKRITRLERHFEFLK